MSAHEIALAKVGLRALIDEATGFQEERDNDDLRKYARSVGLDQYLDLIESRIATGLNAYEDSNQDDDPASRQEDA